MLDIGWTELVVIAIVLIVVVGPKDLPPMLRAFGRMTAKMRGMAGDFRRQFDEALREADLDDVRRTISDAQSLNPTTALRDAMNPLRQLGNEIKSDLQKAATPDKPVQQAPETMAAPANASTPAVEPAKPAAATAVEHSAPASAKSADAKPKRPAKPTAGPTTPAAAKAAPSKAAGSTAVKKSAAKKSAAGAAQAETKSGRTRAATRKKGDA